MKELIHSYCNVELSSLRTKTLGRNCIFYNEIDSTQKEIWRRTKKNEIIDGTLIRCEKQTDGIGTHGRKWYTNGENDIAFSFYMELGCNVDKVVGITIQMAEIIKDIISRLYNVNIEIKLPNDLYVKNKKIGGILTEAKVVGNRVKCLVVGIGINNSQTYFAEEIKDIATSFKKEFNFEIDVEKFLSAFCNSLEDAIKNRIEGN